MGVFMLDEKDEEVSELSEEQYNQLLEDLDNFDSKFFAILAQSDKFEIVPTEMEGEFLRREQYALIKTECTRYGAKILYQVGLRDGSYILINPETLKVGYISERIH